MNESFTFKVSTVITNFNYSRYLTEAIKSITNQNYKNYEIIIVDDNSTDNSRKLLKKIQNKKIKIITHKENKGQLACINSAYKHVKGDIVTFLDADDTYNQNYFQQIVSFYKKNPDISYTYCKIKKFFLKKRFFDIDKKIKYKKVPDSFFLTLYFHKWIGSETSALTILKSELNKIIPNKFEKLFKLNADDYLNYSSSILNLKKSALKNIYINYRVHKNNNYYGKKINSEFINTNYNKISFFIHKLIHEKKIKITQEKFIKEIASYTKFNYIEMIQYQKINFKIDINFFERILNFFTILAKYIC